MIMPSYWRALAAGAIVVAAFAAGWLVNGWRLGTEIETEKRLASERISQGWAAAEKVNRNAAEKYAADLERLGARPPRVVRICPGVPTAATSGPTPGVADTGAGEDIGHTLRGCLSELYRIRALADALQAQPTQ